MLTEIEKFDKVLFQMCIYTEFLNYVTATDILKKMPDINLFELDKILDKMAKEGYLDAQVLHKDLIQYKINYDGKAFWSNGGYGKKAADEKRKIEEEKQKTEEEAKERKLNRWLSISALVIAIIALVYDFIKP